MDKGMKIFKTFENVNKIYKEVSEMLIFIDESLDHKRINKKPLLGQKGKKCTWDTSIAINVPDKWMHKFFVRYYTYDSKENMKKAIGICIWLYGDIDYEVLFERPYISCSIVEYGKETEGDIGEWFRFIGRQENYSFTRHRENEYVMVSSFTGNHDSQEKLYDSMLTYFLDLTFIDSNEKIEDYIIKPSIALLKNDLSKIGGREGFMKLK